MDTIVIQIDLLIQCCYVLCGCYRGSCICVTDIKPENLLIRGDDVLKLCDFGQYDSRAYCLRVLVKCHYVNMQDTVHPLLTSK